MNTRITAGRCARGARLALSVLMLVTAVCVARAIDFELLNRLNAASMERFNEAVRGLPETSEAYAALQRRLDVELEANIETAEKAGVKGRSGPREPPPPPPVQPRPEARPAAPAAPAAPEDPRYRQLTPEELANARRIRDEVQAELDAEARAEEFRQKNRALLNGRDARQSGIVDAHDTPESAAKKLEEYKRQVVADRHARPVQETERLLQAAAGEIERYQVEAAKPQPPPKPPTHTIRVDQVGTPEEWRAYEEAARKYRASIGKPVEGPPLVPPGEGNPNRTIREAASPAAPAKASSAPERAEIVRAPKTPEIQSAVRDNIDQATGRKPPEPVRQYLDNQPESLRPPERVTKPGPYIGPERTANAPYEPGARDIPAGTKPRPFTNVPENPNLKPPEMEPWKNPSVQPFPNEGRPSGWVGKPGATPVPEPPRPGLPVAQPGQVPPSERPSIVGEPVRPPNRVPVDPQTGRRGGWMEPLAPGQVEPPHVVKPQVSPQPDIPDSVALTPDEKFESWRNKPAGAGSPPASEPVPRAGARPAEAAGQAPSSSMGAESRPRSAAAVTDVEAAQNRMMGEAKARIDGLRGAVRSGDPSAVRNAMESIQGDPVALSELNSRDAALLNDARRAVAEGARAGATGSGRPAGAAAAESASAASAGGVRPEVAGPGNLQAYGEKWRGVDSEWKSELAAHNQRVNDLQGMPNGPERAAQLQAEQARHTEVSRELAGRRTEIQDAVVSEANRRVQGGTTEASAPLQGTQGVKPGEPGHRGMPGDRDFGAGSRTADKVPEVLKEMGIDVPVKQTAGTVEIGGGMDMTINKEGPMGRAGSSAHQTQISVDAGNKETYVSEAMKGKGGAPNQPGYEYVEVQDHFKKAQAGLGKDPMALSRDPAAIQDLVKGTHKTLTHVGDDELAAIMRKNGVDGSVQDFRDRMAAMKEGRAPLPESNMQQLQQTSRDIFDRAAANTQTKAGADMEAMRSRIADLEASGQGAEARRLREQMVDSRVRMEETARAGGRAPPAFEAKPTVGSQIKSGLGAAANVAGNLAMAGVAAEAVATKAEQLANEGRGPGLGDVAGVAGHATGVTPMYELGRKESERALNEELSKLPSNATAAQIAEAKARAAAIAGLRMGDQMARGMINDPVDRGVAEEEARARAAGQDYSVMRGMAGSAKNVIEANVVDPFGRAIEKMSHLDTTMQSAEDRRRMAEFVKSNAQSESDKLIAMNKEIEALALRPDAKTNPEIQRQIAEKVGQLDGQYERLAKLQKISGLSGQTGDAGLAEANRFLTTVPDRNSMRDFVGQMTDGKGLPGSAPQGKGSGGLAEGLLNAGQGLIQEGIDKAKDGKLVLDTAAVANEYGLDPKELRDLFGKSKSGAPPPVDPAKQAAIEKLKALQQAAQSQALDPSTEDAIRAAMAAVPDPKPAPEPQGPPPDPNADKRKNWGNYADNMAGYAQQTQEKIDDLERQKAEARNNSARRREIDDEIARLEKEKADYRGRADETRQALAGLPPPPADPSAPAVAGGGRGPSAPPGMGTASTPAVDPVTGQPVDPWQQQVPGTRYTVGGLQNDNRNAQNALGDGSKEAADLLAAIFNSKDSSDKRNKLDQLAGVYGNLQGWQGRIDDNNGLLGPQGGAPGAGGLLGGLEPIVNQNGKPGPIQIPALAGVVAQIDKEKARQMMEALQGVDLNTKAGQPVRVDYQTFQQIKQIMENAGYQGLITRQNAAQVLAQAQNQNSLGNILGTALIDGIKTGAEDTGKALGTKLGDKVGEKITGSDGSGGGGSPTGTDGSGSGPTVSSSTTPTDGSGSPSGSHGGSGTEPSAGGAPSGPPPAVAQEQTADGSTRVVYSCGNVVTYPPGVTPDPVCPKCRDGQQTSSTTAGGGGGKKPPTAPNGVGATVANGVAGALVGAFSNPRNPQQGMADMQKQAGSPAPPGPNAVAAKAAGSAGYDKSAGNWQTTCPKCGASWQHWPSPDVTKTCAKCKHTAYSSDFTTKKLWKDDWEK